MARIKKPDLDKRYIFVDTSILYSDDKTYVVNPNFEEIWQKASSVMPLQLIVPEVVKNEICFQHYKEAEKKSTEVQNATNILSKITDHGYKNRIVNSKIKELVIERFDKWLKKVNGTIQDLPVIEIQWNDIVRAAIWREPPFTSDSNKEKGFKDCLIFETLKYFINNNPSKRVVFICKDRLLRETAEDLYSENDNVTCFDKIDDFNANINLLKEKLTQSFIEKIIKKAQSKFFRKNDNTCVFYNNTVRKKITDKYANELNNPPLSPLLHAFGSTQKYSLNRTQDDCMYIRFTDYLKIDAQSKYIWKTPISVVALFDMITSGIGDTLMENLGKILLPTQKLIRVTKVEVFWAVKIGRDGSFRNVEIQDIKMNDNELRYTIDNDKEEFNLNFKNN
jgi:predicted protein tyrosine phosphatase